ncbi:alpha/beta hydrolase [Enemella evansiae]|uniref:alpha/beta hydrolase n=1 Tax=Enemella evansiae TaxID=2016499 RepID=UPI0010D17D7D|nr:alpha/beta hydrolase [Enemella evansiae]TDO91559.1 arylformamidase [Enemella evansiae]
MTDPASSTDGSESQLDAEYLPSLTVPNADRYFQQWQLNSRSARSNYPHREEAYGSRPNETMDVFEPNRPRATVLFIHGGYWKGFYKEDFSYLAPELLANKCRVVIPSYDLAPEVTLTEIVDQVRRCASMVAEQWSDRLVVSGHSAGGQLAAMLHSTDWEQLPGLTAPKITATIGLSGLYDLEPLRYTSLQQTLNITDAEVAELSAVRRHPTTPAPFLAAVGQLETEAFHEQSRELSECWGAQVTGPRSMPGHNHFTVCDELPRLVAELIN